MVPLQLRVLPKALTLPRRYRFSCCLTFVVLWLKLKSASGARALWTSMIMFRNRLPDEFSRSDLSFYHLYTAFSASTCSTASSFGSATPLRSCQPPCQPTQRLEGRCGPRRKRMHTTKGMPSQHLPWNRTIEAELAHKAEKGERKASRGPVTVRQVDASPHRLF